MNKKISHIWLGLLVMTFVFALGCTDDSLEPIIEDPPVELYDPCPDNPDVPIPIYLPKYLSGGEASGLKGDSSYHAGAFVNFDITGPPPWHNILLFFYTANENGFDRGYATTIFKGLITTIDTMVLDSGNFGYTTFLADGDIGGDQFKVVDGSNSWCHLTFVDTIQKLIRGELNVHLEIEDCDKRDPRNPDAFWFRDVEFDALKFP